ncbi:hypothetical protein [Jeotgalibacillus sp. S-D1]|nr:hypothetical protein [Jeotgalibacillus sp. S-D1]
MGKKMELDLEWVALIKEALGTGISETEIFDFLSSRESYEDAEVRRAF